MSILVKFLILLKANYKISDVKYDLKSGLAVAALSLPIAVAYSEMIGLPPESGIFTAILSLICYMILGSSKDLIMGPDSATIALIAASIFALGGLSGEMNSQFIVLTTIVSGVILFIGGFFRLGFISNFISKPILTGFLNGVAVVLIISQITKLTGVKITNSNSVIGLFEFIGNISSIHFPTLFIGVTALVTIQLLGLKSRRLPSQLMIILISIFAVSVFDLKDLGIIFTPEIKSGIPLPVIPDFSLLTEYYDKIIIDASAIVLISYANTVLVGKSISRDRHTYDPDREFYAMGFVNIVNGIFRGFPASGSSSRTLVNINSGAKTKYSMAFAALSIFIVVLFFSKEFSLIPAAVFAAIIMDAAIGIFKIKDLKNIRDFSKTEFRISMICMSGVMLIGVLDGILIALVLSLLNIIRISSHPKEFELVYNPGTGSTEPACADNENLIRNDIFIYRFEASMLFFNSDYFRKKLFERISGRKDLKLLIIDANPVNFLDVTSGNSLSDIISELDKTKVKVIFFGAVQNVGKKYTELIFKNKSDTRISFPDIRSALEYYNIEKN